MNMKNVLVIPRAYEELNLVQFFKEYMLACLYMLIRQFGRIRFIVMPVLLPISLSYAIFSVQLDVQMMLPSSVFSNIVSLQVNPQMCLFFKCFITASLRFLLRYNGFLP